MMSGYFQSPTKHSWRRSYESSSNQVRTSTKSWELLCNTYKTFRDFPSRPLLYFFCPLLTLHRSLVEAVSNAPPISGVIAAPKSKPVLPSSVPYYEFLSDEEANSIQKVNVSTFLYLSILIIPAGMRSNLVCDSDCRASLEECSTGTCIWIVINQANLFFPE